MSNNNSNNIEDDENTLNILLGITGSVAAIKGPELILQLLQSYSRCGHSHGHSHDGHGNSSNKRKNKHTDRVHIKCILTKSGHEFFRKAKDYNPMIWDTFQGIIRQQSHYEKYRVDFYGAQDEWEIDTELNELLVGNIDDDSDNTDRKLSSSSLELENQHQEQGRVLNYSISDAKNTARHVWNRIGDPVMHIELRNWANVLVIAPLSAHTLAKIANGLCDDLLSCCVRAWDFGHSASGRSGKPVIIAPAMNTAMWEHPITAIQINTFCSFWKKTVVKDASDEMDDSLKQQYNGVTIVPPKAKMLACGEIGIGALADVPDIVTTVIDVLRRFEILFD